MIWKEMGGFMKIIDWDLPQFEEIELFILGDVHIGESGVDERRLNRFMKEVLEQDNRYVIVNGDILNMALKDSVSDIYEEKLNPEEAIDKVIELLTPIKDRILVYTDGNHEKRVSRKDGILIGRRIMREMFGKERGEQLYSSGAYLIFLSFGKNNGRDNRKTCYSIYGKHGAGGGGTVGAKANQLDKMMSIVDADIYIHSHTHVPISFRQGFVRCDYRNRKTTVVEKLFVNSNAFLLFGGYGEELGFKVPSTKYPRLILRGDKREAECIV